MILGVLDPSPQRWRKIKLVKQFVQSTGLKYKYDIPNSHIQYENFKWIAMRGILRGLDKIFINGIKSSANLVYIDNAWWGSIGEASKYFRATVNEYAPSKIIDRDSKRWPKEIKKLGKWQSNNGEHILILPPSEPTANLFNDHIWLDNILAKLKQVTDRSIIIRSKPKIGEVGPNLQEQLSNSYVVISYNSKICVDALTMGIPIYCSKQGPAHEISFNLNNIEENLIEPDRERFIRHLSYCQFSKAEFINGTAWNILKEQR